MSGYNTKQRRALLAFLGEHPDELNELIDSLIAADQAAKLAKMGEN